jgi:chorismate lyase/3-hydroxybenzoate synthase
MVDVRLVSSATREGRGPSSTIRSMSLLFFNSPSLRCVHVPRREQPAGHLLGRIEFGLGLPRGDDPRHVVVGLDTLREAPAECWLSDLPVRHGTHDGFGWAENGEVLFGSIFVPEAELVDLERATCKLYVRIEQLLQRFAYPHYLRMWNFLAQINAGDGDHERYRLFSAGRNRALALKPDFERSLPAATAIGTLEPGLVIYFLAGKQPGLPIENPRQVSAFRYPRQYGPKSPSFARATLIGSGRQSRLLVSGTASVVGHETRHAGDPQRQFDETRANVDALLAHTLALHFADAADAQPESIKLYLRDPALLPLLEARLAALRGPRQAPLLCLHGDVCRTDLLLELEAIYAIDAAPSARAVA